jgi:hypothetical protein
MAIIFQHTGEARNAQLFQAREKPRAEQLQNQKTLFVPAARRLSCILYVRLIHINVITKISEKYVDVNNNALFYCALGLHFRPLSVCSWVIRGKCYCLFILKLIRTHAGARFLIVAVFALPPLPC